MRNKSSWGGALFREVERNETASRGRERLAEFEARELYLAIRDQKLFQYERSKIIYLVHVTEDDT